MMWWIGIPAAFLIGLSLGLLGAGGGILAIPLLVYVFKIPVIDATAHSQVIIAIVSGIGVILAQRKGKVNWHILLRFGLVSVVSTLIARYILFHWIPDTIGIFHYSISRSMLLMMGFAILLCIVAWRMMIPLPEINNQHANSAAIRWVFAGIGAGFLTGIFGAGGGILIIPALVILGGESMQVAAGTSLAIITCNTLVGACISAAQVHWHSKILILVIGCAILGMWVGGMWAKKWKHIHLQKGFAVFCICIAIYIVVKECLL